MNIQSGKTPTAVFHNPAMTDQISVGLERLFAFRDDLNKVDEALNELSTLVGKSSARVLARHRKEMAAFEPTVTVLGQVKAGKTALVNAMSGWADLLPSDVNPWTSVVTSLHLRPSMDLSDTAARFRFLSNSEWDRLLTKGGRMGELSRRSGAESELQKIVEQVQMVRDRARKRLGKKYEMLIGQEHEYGYFDKNLLEKYICVGDDYSDEEETLDQGRFAEILRSADLFLGSRHFPCNFCIRDTPGVNDTFMMREQITLQAVRESRLCLVTLSASQALTSVDMGLIRLISNLKSRDIVIFVNRIDDLSKPSEQIPEIEASIRATLRAKQAPEGIKIVFGSAAWATAALSGDIEQMAPASANALLDWAAVKMDRTALSENPNAIVWELSGLPALFRILSDRIVDGIGAPMLRKICESATTIATSRSAVEKIRIEAAERDLSPQRANDTFDALERERREKFENALGEAVADYNARTDRAHQQFIQRATQSLISHLEKYGPMAGWKYDPTGLRVLVRSGYSVFSKRIQTLTKTHSSESLVGLAELYSSMFGEAVEGIQLALPEPPDIPPPVSIGQTIALDFNDGWWMSWWKRLRGYDAFARQFNELISAETED
ncbi:MAG: dynamin family protein, partial [Pseudomonadota bacterium]